MIEELREEEIIKKVGGRFKLSTLIQKRLVQLNAGARPLVAANDDNKMQIVINEIMQDKVYLDTDLNVQVAAGAKQPEPLELDFRNL
jgi:DNA-directed RNA polymerase subunit omega